VYEVISIEDMNKPAVGLCNKGFFRDAQSSAMVRGMPGARYVLETIQPHSTVLDEIANGVSAAMDEIIAALTKPLTAKEKNPMAQKVEKHKRIIFTGDLEEVNRFIYTKGWGDGLPIVPPTEKAVAEMLKGTDLKPDYVVAKIIPRLGKATVEKIAINAVMAGALPTYMPALIAGVQAAFGPGAKRGPWQLGSTLSPAPFWVINGPMRNDVHLNYSTGMLTPGDMPNSAIGRAMFMIVKNIGGMRKGVEDMGVIGNPGKFARCWLRTKKRVPGSRCMWNRGSRRKRAR
jgi:hypothetical protein